MRHTPDWQLRIFHASRLVRKTKYVEATEIVVRGRADQQDRDARYELRARVLRLSRDTGDRLGPSISYLVVRYPGYYSVLDH